MLSAIQIEGLSFVSRQLFNPKAQLKQLYIFTLVKRRGDQHAYFCTVFKSIDGDDEDDEDFNLFADVCSLLFIRPG